MSKEKTPEGTQNITSEEFQRRKTAFCAWFAAIHHSAFRPHWDIGETLGRKEGQWRNVAEHCLIVGIFADILAEAAVTQGYLTNIQREKIVVGALLHDWSKKIEVRVIEEKQTLSLPLLDGFDDLRGIEERVLERFEFSQETIRLSQVNNPISPQGPKTISEMIVWYSDAIMQNTTPVPIEERLSGLERGWDGTKVDPERGRRNIARSETLRRRLGGLSEYEYVRMTQKRVEPFLAALMGFDEEPADLPFFLEQKFRERVMSFQP